MASYVHISPIFLDISTHRIILQSWQVPVACFRLLCSPRTYPLATIFTGSMLLLLFRQTRGSRLRFI